MALGLLIMVLYKTLAFVIPDMQRNIKNVAVYFQAPEGCQGNQRPTQRPFIDSQKAIIF